VSARQKSDEPIVSHCYLRFKILLLSNLRQLDEGFGSGYRSLACLMGLTSLAVWYPLVQVWREKTSYGSPVACDPSDSSIFEASLMERTETVKRAGGARLEAASTRTKQRRGLSEPLGNIVRRTAQEIQRCSSLAGQPVLNAPRVDLRFRG
jgi:hypothetical protein